MNYLYDASYINALIIPDEKNSMIDKHHRAVDENDEIYTPQLLWYEIANTFRKLNKQKRYPCDVTTHFFKILSAIRMITDFGTGVDYLEKIWELGNKYKLSAYDAAYLELADRKKAVLCTLDDDLLEAAKKHGVKVISM